MLDRAPVYVLPRAGILEKELWPAVNSVKKLHTNGIGGKLFHSEQGQALAEYAAMLTLVLSLLYLVKMIGFNANRVFNFVASTLQ